MELSLIISLLQSWPIEVVQLIFSYLDFTYLKVIVETGGPLNSIAFEVYYKNIGILNGKELGNLSGESSLNIERVHSRATKDNMVYMDRSEFIEFRNSHPLYNINNIAIEARNLFHLSQIPQILKNIVSINLSIPNSAALGMLHVLPDNIVSIIISPDDNDYLDNYAFPPQLQFFKSLSGKIRNINDFLDKLPHLQVLDLKTSYIPLTELAHISQLDKLCIPSTCFIWSSYNNVNIGSITKLVIYHQQTIEAEDEDENENVNLLDQEEVVEEYYIEDAMGNSVAIYPENEDNEEFENNSDDIEEEYVMIEEYDIINEELEENLITHIEPETVIDLSKNKHLLNFSYFNSPTVSLKSIMLPQDLVSITFSNCGYFSNLSNLDKLIHLKNLEITAEFDFEAYVTFFHKTKFPKSLTKLMAANTKSKRDLTELATAARSKHPYLFIGFSFQVGEKFALPESLKVLELRNFPFVSFSHWWKIPHSLESWTLWDIDAIVTLSANRLLDMTPKLQHLSMNRVKIDVLDNFYLPRTILDIEFSQCGIKKINHTNLLNLPNIRSLVIKEDNSNRAMPLPPIHEPFSINGIELDGCDFTNLNNAMKFDLSGIK